MMEFSYAPEVEELSEEVLIAVAGGRGKGMDPNGDPAP